MTALRHSTRGISLTGDKELDKNLKLLGNAMERNIVRKGMRAFTAKIRNAARKNAPKRTGKLRKSIVNKVSMRSDGRVIGKVIISPKKYGVMYGHWVEWGRQYPPLGAQHFMTRAFEKFNSKQLFADEVSIAYDSYLAKMVGKHR
jgi:HK97 gp10 family phage protein